MMFCLQRCFEADEGWLVGLDTIHATGTKVRRTSTFSAIRQIFAGTSGGLPVCSLSYKFYVRLLHNQPCKARNERQLNRYITLTWARISFGVVKSATVIDDPSTLFFWCRCK